jgi:hypothetical protein
MEEHRYVFFYGTTVTPGAREKGEVSKDHHHSVYYVYNKLGLEPDTTSIPKEIGGVLILQP